MAPIPITMRHIVSISLQALFGLQFGVILEVYAAATAIPIHAANSVPFKVLPETAKDPPEKNDQQKPNFCHTRQFPSKIEASVEIRR